MLPNSERFGEETAVTYFIFIIKTQNQNGLDTRKGFKGKVKKKDHSFDDS